MFMCVFKFFFEITEPTEDIVHVGPPQDPIGEKIYSNDSGQLFFISSPEPLGSQGELIVYPSSRRPSSSVRPSSVVRPSTIFKDLLL